MSTNWVHILDKVKTSVGVATFAEDWAEDMVTIGLENIDSDVALVLDLHGEVEIRLLDKGEHATTEDTVEIARIPAFGDVDKQGEKKLAVSPVGSFVNDGTWLEFVTDHLIGVKGLEINNTDAKTSREMAKGLGVTWEDFKDWDVGEYGQAVDGFVTAYLAKVREHLVGKINNFK
ncbi:hypothetical protein [Bacillus mycoides]|uniref:hypothetical protein n=1 Tax=Bacillus mycoides TaxID=1405 RepID=UPI003A804F5F